MEKIARKHKRRNKFKTNILQQNLLPACFWDRAAANQDASFVNWSCLTEQTDKERKQDVSEREQPVKPGDMFWWLTEDEAEMFLYLESHSRHPIRFPLAVTEEPQDTATPTKTHHAGEALLGQADNITRPKTEQVALHSEVEHLEEMQAALNAEHGTRIKLS